MVKLDLQLLVKKMDLFDIKDEDVAYAHTCNTLKAGVNQCKLHVHFVVWISLIFDFNVVLVP